MTLQDILALIALVVAVVALPSALITMRAARRGDGRDAFLTHLRSLRDHQFSLAGDLLDRSPQGWRVTGFPMLARTDWVPGEPFDLSELSIVWRDHDDVAFVEQARRRAARVLAPLRVQPITRYSDALVRIAEMDQLFDGVVYRLVDVELGDDVKQLTFSRSSYFAYLDTCEVLAFEAERRRAAGKRVDGRGSYRRALKDPFDCRNRVTSLGVNTLTIRVEGRRGGFYLHQRNPKSVVNNSSQLGLVPAGEFTPSDRSAEALVHDRDIWRNIMREYAEEFLGADDAQGQGGRWIDYRGASPYRELEQARVAGKVRVKVLGLGIDPLPWKPELLTVCLIDADVFDAVFPVVPDHNSEGTILAGNGHDGLPFDAPTVARYCAESTISPNAKACLSLAWRSRAELGLGAGRGA